MTNKKLLSSALAALLAVMWLVAMPLDAFATPPQRSVLVQDASNNCTGTTVGKSVIKNKNDGTIKVKVKFKTGPANDSGTVYWTCTNVSNGCHDQACGFISLGTVATGSTGKGKFITILPSNPFPGSFVHLDVVMEFGVFDSVFPNVPLGASGGASGAKGGDPTR